MSNKCNQVICSDCNNKLKNIRCQNCKIIIKEKLLDISEYDKMKAQLAKSVNTIQLIQQKLANETKNIEQLLSNSLNEIQQISQQLTSTHELVRKLK